MNQKSRYNNYMKYEVYKPDIIPISAIYQLFIIHH